MKILIAILMMFLIVSCSSTEDYELDILSLKAEIQRLEKQVNKNTTDIKKNRSGVNYATDKIICHLENRNLGYC